MDDLIDLELEKIAAILEKIKEDPEPTAVKQVEQQLWETIQLKAMQGRRTGLGITAEADMLAALDLRYGSEQSIVFSTKIHRLLALNAYTSSVELAKQRGAFPIYDSSRESENPFINRLKIEAPSLYEQMCQFGRRNIALLTIAPTGTTSLMAQTSSGIEPIFMPVYQRRRKVNPGDKNTITHFKDELGDYWETYRVFHHKFKDWMMISGHDTNKNYSQQELDNLVSQSPYYKSTSSDVDYKAKVRLQGAIQKWVDHSISVTINMPQTVNEELVGDLYMEAWQFGCKGITVYREGSRYGVLMGIDNNKKKEEEAEEEKKEVAAATGGHPPNSMAATSPNPPTAHISPKTSPGFPLQRPEIIQAAVIHFKNKEEKWIAFIGLIDQKPYEIFTGIADDTLGILLPKWVKQGVIIKVHQTDGPSRYDFQYENQQGYKITIQGLSHKFNPEYWNYAKLISGILRHGMSIEKVVKLVNGLQLKDDNINTWKNGIARALRRFIPNHTQIMGGQCQQCGGHHLQYREGCLICQDCGHSKCE
ncbi:ribonucleoside-diphosphate reductase alpha chain [Arachidicoccus rhizosphaerae]|uniref:Ribonucleoside-diphosphate reductase alpha chain n=1 Tax=Arachidicoccus rhizosphaerae TaxID=551991 RepID=A0A1H4BCZ6_9BACT|nr:ribonucleoside-diphosphate reductase alpha chain [Arachidicoccus rhizosphaerae]